MTLHEVVAIRTKGGIENYRLLFLKVKLFPTAT